MNYSIERGKPGDEAVFAHIQTESWKAGFQGILSPDILERVTDIGRVTAMYRDILAQNYGNGYILKVDGKPHCIAWWGAAREKNMPGYAELICIHSLPDNWRNGYGSRMMERVLQDIATAGYSKVMLWVFEENARARRFYEALGFTTEGRKKPDSAPTEICYEKDL